KTRMAPPRLTGVINRIICRRVPRQSCRACAMPALRWARIRDMPLRTRDLRVENIRPLLPPAILLEELPVSETASQTVSRGREEVSKILWGEDDRLIVIVGPCSIHDPKA